MVHLGMPAADDLAGQVQQPIQINSIVWNSHPVVSPIGERPDINGVTKSAFRLRQHLERLAVEVGFCWRETVRNAALCVMVVVQQHHRQVRWRADSFLTSAA